MSGFSDVLKTLGYGVGVVTGGPSQVKAVAGAVSAQGKINSYLDSFGKKIGGIVGPDIFNKIAGGATITGNAETKSFVDKNILTNNVKASISMVAVIALIGISYFFYKDLHS